MVCISGVVLQNFCGRPYVRTRPMSCPGTPSTKRWPRPENTAMPRTFSRFCGFSGPRYTSIAHELPRPLENTAAPAFDRSSLHLEVVAKWCHTRLQFDTFPQPRGASDPL